MRLNLTTEEFIRKAKQVHGDKYEYTKVNYINSATKVCIICPKHGEFWQTPNSHLTGNGCPKCANEEKSSTTEKFIDKANKVHNGRYTYENAVYVNCQTPLLITCPIHGDFSQTPNEHLSGSGCPKCAKEKQFLTTEEFIDKANKVHKGKYTYENAVYVNYKTPLCITCLIHGNFLQTPTHHLRGNGCPQCAKEQKSSTTEKFIDKANKVHNGRYTYENAVYVNYKTPLLITCPIHGDFSQTPTHHLRGNGCPQCAKEEKTSTTEDFVNKATKIHNGKYTYEKAVYVHSQTPLCITCPIHGDFLQQPNTHLRGSGCPLCANEEQFLTTEEFIDRAKKVHNGKYTYEKAVYVHSQTPLCITCPIHGDFKQTPSSHLQGQGCPQCGLSFRISENRFYDFLKLFLPNAEIVREFGHKQVLGKLRLDFYLPDYRIGLEYHGRQHFKPVKRFGGENGFKEICERDKRKFQKCNEHGIKMFYFTYETKSVPKDYFAKVYTDEDELKRDVLAYIEESSLQPQPQMAHSLNWMANFACFEPKDTFL